MENIFQELLCGRENEGNDPLQWETLSIEAKKRVWKTAKFDIDFICFCMPGIAFASSAAVEVILSKLHGQFRRECYVVKMRTPSFKQAAVICEIHPYKIAVPIGVFVETPGDEVFDPVELETEEKSSEEIRKELNSILSHAPKSLIPFRDLKPILRSLFGGHRLCAFLFGQKQSVESFIDEYSRLAQESLMFIAVGAEIEKESDMMLCSHEGFNINTNFYSLALSPNAGCLLVKEEPVCRNIIQSAYRFCVYSTVHHLRKDYPFGLKVLVQQEGNNAEEQREKEDHRNVRPLFSELLEQAVSRTSENKSRFQDFFDAEKLRLERPCEATVTRMRN